MKVKKLGNQTFEQLEQEVQSGGKFVIYQYCISILFMSYKCPSDVYYIKPGEGGVKQGLVFSLISLILGWWGIPWGPIYTIGSFTRNFNGGKDVTSEIMQYFRNTVKTEQEQQTA